MCGSVLKPVLVCQRLRKKERKRNRKGEIVKIEYLNKTEKNIEFWNVGYVVKWYNIIYKVRNDNGSDLNRVFSYSDPTRGPDPDRLLNGFFFRGPLSPARFGPKSWPNQKKKKRNH